MGSKEATSFNKIIKADREKREREAVANSILGANRRSSAPGNAALLTARKAPAGPGSLASRMGVVKASSAGPGKPSVTKRGAEATGNPRFARNAQLQRTASEPRLRSHKQRILQDLVAANAESNGLRSQVNYNDRTNGEISVRGMGGPYTVIAQNFAVGTTAADIETVLAPEKDVGLVSCRLVARNPTVIAELVFSERRTAEQVVATFNNKKADGRLLYVYMKDASLGAARGAQSQGNGPTRGDRDIMEVDDGPDQREARDQRILRDERAQRDQRDQKDGGDRPTDFEPRGQRADVSYQDGRYGFPENNSYNNRDNRRNYDNRNYANRGRYGSGLASDNMMQHGGGGRYYRP